MGNGGKYHGGHGGGGKDLPPLSEIDSCSKAGRSRIRYGENDLPKICRNGKGLSSKAKTQGQKPKALEPPFTPNPPAMAKQGDSSKVSSSSKANSQKKAQ